MINKYDTQLLIDARKGQPLSQEDIIEYFENDLDGDCLLVVGDESLIKIHFHTDEPWKVLEYCSTIGDIYDIVVEDMERQSNGLHG